MKVRIKDTGGDYSFAEAIAGKIFDASPKGIAYGVTIPTELTNNKQIVWAFYASEVEVVEDD